MDSGRVLRALLAFKMDRNKVTRIATAISRALATVFVLFGIFYNVWLVFIGLFIYFGADSEAAYETTKSLLSGFRVADVDKKVYYNLLMIALTGLHMYYPKARNRSFLLQ